MPLCPIDGATQIPKTVQLADPQFHIPSKIDVLIGADIFWDLLTGDQFTVDPGFPKLHGTVLGFIVGGRILEQRQQPKTIVSLTCTVNDLNEQIQMFWLQEEVLNDRVASLEERECELHYKQTTVRQPDGRYTVSLPTKPEIMTLSDTKGIALRQFYRLEQRLQREPEIQKLYHDFMQEYIELQHMESVDETADANPEAIQYYMPHHHVLKPSSNTTKLRVVFNASFKIGQQPSLNDALKVGPTIQADLFTIILRFRKHQYALTADITKMYRQILIQKDQRRLQRIWWRPNELEAARIYQLSTVTYGTASAPFLAIRTLQQLAMDEMEDFPEASRVALNDFYVDDVITGASTIQQLKEIQQQLQLLMKRGGFELHKWASNYNDVSTNPENSIMFPKVDQTRTLGLIWRPEKDQFIITWNKLEVHTNYTKRMVLSEIARLYDPLGFCAPLVFWAKTLMQELWKVADLQWDDPLSETLQRKWTTFRKQLNNLDELKIPRCALPPNATTLELHGFGDASELGFGCCIYMRASDQVGNHSLTFLCARSRVAPLKKTTIPRLELSAAVLLAELTKRVVNAMGLEYQRIVLWTDSTITLCRIQSQSSRYTTFVANRIARIQELSSPEQWRHVPGSQNPADLVSRGLLPDDFVKADIWFHGPAFLLCETSDWPILCPWRPETNEQTDDELKGKDKVITCITTIADRMVDNFSNYTRALRISALCRRFAANCKVTQDKRNNGYLSAAELNEALHGLTRVAQHEDFAEDMRKLQGNSEVNNKSKLRALRPFLDERLILRVGGRLQNSNLRINQRHPMLLNAKHPLSRLLARHYHEANLHAGSQALLYALRQQFWIIGGRNLCRKTVHNCVQCFRAKPIVAEQLMGRLPTARVQPARPFLRVGIDFCGPFNCKPRIRSKAVLKTYVCVFVCFATKAVHMEIVNDLTTDGFLAALRRFVARRGRCLDIYSDNATNFVGGNRALQELYKMFQDSDHQEIIQRFCANEGINWHMIPPDSPHFGGLWESAVKAAKHHMRRVLGTTTLSTEELGTVITQIEACLNSRPLSPMSTDPSDLEPLTPGHFLIGAPLNSIIEPDLSDLKLNRLSRWQLVQHIVQDFWRRWSREYLSELQTRKKWRETNPNIQPGTMVLLKADRVPPLKWPLGRIIELFPGRDDLTRVVSVKTKHGIYKRSITKVCILPIETKE